MSEPQSVVETRVVHDLHRAATTLLADATRRPSADPAAVDELRTFLIANLRHHHESEDDRLWPMIERVAPGASAPLAGLTDEHHELDEALDALAAAPLGDPSLADAAAAVRDTVHRHLDHEEPVLFPALREHVTVADWEEFSAYVMSTAPVAAAHLNVGFFDRVATADEVAMMLSGLPEPVRALVPMMREQAAATFAALGA
ncbi:hemerythrin domain-containing protein [Actinoplanes philippinensis]|uniref:hemerythrin domain-containing protein n=1 Tax=Actinoplanes philippinensis TaxID=35752 RepID=UPI003404AC68